jgi:outer membrane receptor protein involved in Fe transport
LTDPFCNLITRDPQTLAIYGGNGLGFINQTELNAESLATKGVDVNGDYRTSLSDWHLPDYGSLDLSFTGTFVNNLTTSFPGSSYNCAGLYGTTCGTPTPKYRSQTRLTWITPWNLTLSVQWRYLSATRLDLNSDQVALQGAPGMSQVYNDERIPDFNYFDVSFMYKFRDRYTIRGGVNNIFDRIPPLVSANSFAISAPPFGNANTYPQVFDPLGRVLFLGLTADF